MLLIALTSKMQIRAFLFDMPDEISCGFRLDATFAIFATRVHLHEHFQLAPEAANRRLQDPRVFLAL